MASKEPPAARAADVDPVASDARPTDSPAPVEAASRSAEWPFRDRRAFASGLHAMGRDLSTRWFTYSTLAAWQDATAALGLSYYDPGLGALMASDTAMVYVDDFWAIAPIGSTGRGWRLYERFKRPDWSADNPLAAEDWDGVSMPADRPTVVCIGRKGRCGQWPTAEELPGLSVVVAPGNCRIVVVPLGSERRVQVLPFALDGIEREPYGAQWPFRRRDVFATGLRDLGRQLSAAGDDDALQLWADSAKGLGLRYRVACDAAPGSVDLGFGFSIDASDAVDKGWRVRRLSDTHAASGAETAAPELFMPAREPAMAFLSAEGWTVEPPSTGLEGTILLISPGNARLVVIEMQSDGLVSILPQAFD